MDKIPAPVDPAEVGGWITGAMVEQPEYSPTRLVNHIVNILRAEGLRMPTYRGTDDDEPGVAAAALLRTLNLTPTSDTR